MSAISGNFNTFKCYLVHIFEQTFLYSTESKRLRDIYTKVVGRR